MPASTLTRMHTLAAILLVAAGGCSSTHSSGSSNDILPSGPHARALARSVNDNKADPAGSGLSVVTVANAASNTGIVSDGAGGEWMGNNNNLVRVDESTGAVSQYTLAKAEQVVPGTVGPVDHAVWFTYMGASGANGVGFIDQQIHRIKEYRLSSLSISGMTAGPDNAMWLTYWNQNDKKYRIGRLDLGTSKLTGFPTPGGRRVGAIIAGPDGGLWFDDSTDPHPKLGRIDPYSHQISEYSVGFDIEELLVGPDGAIWFDRGTFQKSVGRFSVTTHAVTYYDTGPAAGPLTSRDLDLWFTVWDHSNLTRHLGKLNTATGHYRKYTLPSKIFGLATGADDQLWANNTTSVFKICPDLDEQTCAGSSPR